MKSKKMLLILAAIIFVLSCSNENSIEKSNIKKQSAAENIKNSKTEKEYLKSINYSNIADKMVQDEIKESLENAGVDSNNIDLFFKSVNYYNEATENKDLIKSGFINSKNINPIYDEVAIQKIWDKKDNSIHIDEKLYNNGKASCKNWGNAFYGYRIIEEYDV